MYKFRYIYLWLIPFLFSHHHTFFVFLFFWLSSLIQISCLQPLSSVLMSLVLAWIPRTRLHWHVHNTQSRYCQLVGCSLKWLLNNALKSPYTIRWNYHWQKKPIHYFQSFPKCLHLICLSAPYKKCIKHRTHYLSPKLSITRASHCEKILESSIIVSFAPSDWHLFPYLTS